MKRLVAASVTAVAAGVMIGLSAGQASAWVDPSITQSPVAGVIEGSSAVLTYTNPLDTELQCATSIFTADKLATATEFAAKSEEFYESINAGTPNYDLLGETAELSRELGEPVNASDPSPYLSIPAGQTRSKTTALPDPVADTYTGLSICAPNSSAARTAAPGEALSGAQARAASSAGFEADVRAFQINRAATGSGSLDNVWGSLGDLLP